jgi:N utilization substance protein B
MLEFHTVPFEETLALAVAWSDKKDAEKIKSFTSELVSGVITNKDSIDKIIRETSHNWRIDRMAVVDRNILRIATFEMLKMPDIPYKVSLNEAIELAKRFGSEDSSSFINGVLDNISIKLERK